MASVEVPDREQRGPQQVEAPPRRRHAEAWLADVIREGVAADAQYPVRVKQSGRKQVLGALDLRGGDGSLSAG